MNFFAFIFCFDLNKQNLLPISIQDVDGKQQCFHCGKFKSKLKNHILRNHTDIRKLLKCNHNQCDKSFKTYADLWNHKRTHVSKIAKIRKKVFKLIIDSFIVSRVATKNIAVRSATNGS